MFPVVMIPIKGVVIIPMIRSSNDSYDKEWFHTVTSIVFLQTDCKNLGRLTSKQLQKYFFFFHLMTFHALFCFFYHKSAESSSPGG